MSGKKLVGGFTLVLLLGTMALAQPPGGRRGGFGPGFGGFGGQGGGLAGLVRIEKVQEELELLDEQKTEINKFLEEQRGQRQQRGERPNFREMSEEERERFFAQAREEAQKREKETREKLGAILLPHQLERLEQLDVQRRGVQALADPEIQAKLSFTDEQRTKLTEVQQQISEQMREAFQGAGGGEGGGDRQAIFERIQKMRTESEAKLLGVLTDEQKKQFEEMKGEAFEFPAPQFGRGGRGGQGGGRRGGNNNNN